MKKKATTTNPQETLFNLESYSNQPSYQADWAFDNEADAVDDYSSELKLEELPVIKSPDNGEKSSEELPILGNSSELNKGQCHPSGRIEWHDKIKRLKSGEVRTYSYNVYRWQFGGRGKVWFRTIPTGKLWEVTEAIASGETSEAIVLKFWKVRPPEID